MKTVFDNAMVAHVWAQREQEHGRSKSMSFRGDTLYSYSTPIAHFMPAIAAYNEENDGEIRSISAGEIVCLITSRKYSITTSSKHMPALNRAVSHYPCFYVDDVMGDHEANLKALSDQYEKELRTLARSRTGADWKIASLQRLRRQAIAYATIFNMGLNKDYFKLAFPEPSAEEISEAKARALNAAKAIADKRRIEDAAKRQELDNLIAQWIDNKGCHIPWNWKAYASDEQRKRINDHAALLWKQGYSVQRDLLEEILLRLKDANTIETSAGAEFPIEHARRAWPVILNCKNGNRGWQKNGHKVPLGHFELDKIDPNGDVKAGCHYVAFSEIERIAAQLGLA